MTKPLRLGLVGADASGRGWGPVAHIPALRAIEQIELTAVCESSRIGSGCRRGLRRRPRLSRCRRNGGPAGYRHRFRCGQSAPSNNGANFVTIAAGHTIDYVSYCLGPLAEVSASVTTQFPQWKLGDTGETIDVDAPDTVLLSGTLAGGGRLSFHAASVPFNGSNWRMEIYGTKGTIVAATPVLPQISPITLKGAQGEEPLSELPTPERLAVAPEAVPPGPARNVAGAYVRMAEAIRQGNRFDPDFDHARELHELLETLQLSSDDGRAVTVNTAT